jgi:hypothetical protein
MLSLETNLDSVITLITDRLENINFEELTALQASTVMGEMRKEYTLKAKTQTGGKLGIIQPDILKFVQDCIMILKLQKRA